SISRLIQKAQEKYARAFLYTETDENDLTYFILYHLGLIKQSIEEVRKFVERQTKARSLLEERLQKMRELNHRQRKLIAHALRNPGFRYTAKSHMVRQRITHQTAMTDLYDLAERGLLQKMKVGRTFNFYPVSDLERRLSGSLK
ncbi:MAG: Fic family protein, partial [Proteobacteria bacterium]|nr:Fic family protein [Pseudomonadota bacterium]